MAAPTLRGVGAYGSGTTSFVAAVPTAGNAPQAGDAMYIIMESSDSTTAAGTPNTPGGWSKLVNDNTINPGATNVSTLTVFGKIAGAGEGNVTVDGVGDHCSGAMVVVAGHGLAAITNTVVGSVTNHGVTTTGCSTAGITVIADSFIIQAIAFTDDAADTTNHSGQANANLANGAERIDNTVATGAGGGVGIWTATCAGTTTGATTWNHDTAIGSQSVHLGVYSKVALTVADGSHSHSTDGVLLTQHNVLALQDATHGHSSDAIALTQHNILAMADALHGHTTDDVTLVFHEGTPTLVIQDAIHGHPADNVDLVQHNILSIADASHPHTGEGLDLVQHNVLSISDGAHGHNSDGIDLTQHNTLSLSDAVHSHVGDNLVLTYNPPPGTPLVIQNGLHIHGVDSIVLVQHNVLTIQDALHSLTSDNVVLYVGGSPEHNGRHASPHWWWRP